MCFSLDFKTQKWQVIDGLQRISTIIKFLNDENWRLSKLSDVDVRISGRSVLEIKEIEEGKLYQMVENLTIPVTVLRCDYTRPQHTNYLFTIFHRLNTGGLKLTNQEIRNAIYNGPLNDLLKECNNKIEWRTLIGIKSNVKYRFAKEELILRFFAFFDRLETYQGTLSKFLNDYMETNKNISGISLSNKRALFNSTIEILLNLGKFKLSNVGTTVIEALMYGVAKNLDSLANASSARLQALYLELTNDSNFALENLVENISAKTKVINRLNAAQVIFSRA